MSVSDEDGVNRFVPSPVSSTKALSTNEVSHVLSGDSSCILGAVPDNERVINKKHNSHRKRRPNSSWE